VLSPFHRLKSQIYSTLWLPKRSPQRWFEKTSKKLTLNQHCHFSSNSKSRCCLIVDGKLEQQHPHQVLLPSTTTWDNPNMGPTSTRKIPWKIPTCRERQYKMYKIIVSQPHILTLSNSPDYTSDHTNASQISSVILPCEESQPPFKRFGMCFFR
jgi:hypothetical protein